MIADIAARQPGKHMWTKWHGNCSAAAASAALMAMFEAGIAPAFAASGNVTFEGTIDTNASSTVTVRQNGRFGISSDFRTLSSKIAGGQVGIADVFAMGSYSVSATMFPILNAAPSGGTMGTMLQPLFSGTSILLGANFAERPGTSPVALPLGVSLTRINTHLVATRTGSMFATGLYQGIIVVRCE